MKVNDAGSLGAIVRDRRTDLGLSQTQLAERVGITRQLLSRFEQGRSDLGATVMFGLLAALDLAVDVRRRAAPPVQVIPQFISEDRPARVRDVVNEANRAHTARIEALRRRLAEISFDGSADGRS